MINPKNLFFLLNSRRWDERWAEDVKSRIEHRNVSCNRNGNWFHFYVGGNLSHMSGANEKWIPKRSKRQAGISFESRNLVVLSWRIDLFFSYEYCWFEKVLSFFFAFFCCVRCRAWKRICKYFCVNNKCVSISFVPLSAAKQREEWNTIALL